MREPREAGLLGAKLAQFLLTVYFPAATVIPGPERGLFGVLFFDIMASECMLTASTGVHLKKHQSTPKLGEK